MWGRQGSVAVSLVVVVLVVGTVAAVTGGVVTAEPSTGAPTSLQPAPNQAGQQVTGCDYATLYNRTVDSLVLVQAGAAQGSGFVYSRTDGTSVVVTNEHVVDGNATVGVRFNRGEFRSGRVVGTDANSDLAAVRVNDTPSYAAALPVANTTPEPGAPVAALGSPFGLAGTITHGIVSAVDRSMPTDQGFSIPNTIQTDAPINPGNSGGPLITCDGTVVGVNRAGGGQNIGFAVSASLVRRVVPALLGQGQVRYAYLGVSTLDVSPLVAEANGLNSTNGVLVVDVVPGGPSSGVIRGSTGTRTVAGIAVPAGGDVLVGIGGTPIRTQEDLAGFLSTEAAPGDTVTVTVLRDGRRQTLTVTLGERPPANVTQSTAVSTGPDNSEALPSPA